MLQDSVRRFAKDVVEPKVREMDEVCCIRSRAFYGDFICLQNEMMDPEVIRGLFDQGVSKQFQPLKAKVLKARS